jgi:hypothetical protein
MGILDLVIILTVNSALEEHVSVSMDMDSQNWQIKFMVPRLRFAYNSR